ncbi:ATP-dependent DNA helicase RecG [Schwartzia sp. (in: firmicutes)]
MGLSWEDTIDKVKGVGPKKAQALKKLGVSTLYDLLTYYPRAYIDQSHRTPFAELHAGETATVSGVITNLNERRGSRRGMTILTAVLSDGTGWLQMTWFNQPFLKKKLLPGRRVLATGKLTYAFGGRGALAMSQMQTFEVLDVDDNTPLGVLPVYSSTEALNQNFFRKIIRELLANHPELSEVIPEAVTERFELMDRWKAFLAIHFPESMEQLRRARARLAFEELYIIQCGLLLIRKDTMEKEKGIRHLMDSRLMKQVYGLLPFELTADQAAVWKEISADMEKSAPMRRLVQGDVGSGKTALALLALAKTIENGYQGAFMAPTEILARQHYEKISELLKDTEIRVGLLTGSLTPKKHREMLEQIENHQIDLVVGTHALIQEKVVFAALGLVVTDEQHRFGISQRAALSKKSDVTPDVLVMTATPIPRTMTLTVYGDLDVSRIEHLPPGRQPIRTFLRHSDRRGLIYDFVRKEIEAGRQAYVVCPLIEHDDENEDNRLCAAVDVYEELSHGIFHGIPCGLVHGRLPAKDKEKVMADFHDGKIKLLVSTTVIEVGVDVPNASIMVIENADRFGLAQLHQLRGRVGRGTAKSYCILVSENRSPKTQERLKIMEQTSNGFVLAEEDLRLRGPGQFFGAMQHGLGDLKIANVLTDTDILMKARRAAQETMITDEERKYMEQLLAIRYKMQFENITDS